MKTVLRSTFRRIECGMLSFQPVQDVISITVIGEAMSEGCAVVAGEDAGASRVLLQHGETGLMFPTCDVKQLAGHLEILIRNQEFRQSLGRKAAINMRDMWSPRVAAERLLGLCDTLLAGKATPYSDGPGSVAPILYDSRNHLRE